MVELEKSQESKEEDAQDLSFLRKGWLESKPERGGRRPVFWHGFSKWRIPRKRSKLFFFWILLS